MEKDIGVGGGMSMDPATGMGGGGGFASSLNWNQIWNFWRVLDKIDSPQSWRVQFQFGEYISKVTRHCGEYQFSGVSNPEIRWNIFRCHFCI